MRDVLTPEEFAKQPDNVQAEAIAICNAINAANQSAYTMYEIMLKGNVPRELARSILPVGMYSHMFATANLHNWFRFLSERLHPHAQYEIRVYAEAILTILEDLFPVATAAFKDTL